MAFDYKKEYKEFYMPKNKPGIIEISKMNYIAVRGKGNPNEENGEYKNSIGLLYDKMCIRDRYFKILRDGKIRRKIASFLCMEGIRNCPETRGKREYESASGHVYKADMQARHMKDMLPDFTGREVRALMDYYIDMSRFTDENIRRILIYALSVEEENL